MLKKALEETIEIMSKKIDSLETSAEVDRDHAKAEPLVETDCAKIGVGGGQPDSL